ncbi:Crp/Fnr family transcriptional regulator [Myroides odoratus]|uniref:Crp/Fnr family transcriptional regulator n=1 Tax=Myroides odoratus TaxID=256 RepID=UPI0039AECA11
MDQFVLEKFREKINTYSPISEASFEALLNIATIRRLKKNEIFIEQGFVCRQFCFLYSGYLIAYINDSEGRTYNKNIFVPSDWVSSLVSAILQQPSQFTAKAVTDCVILSLPYKAWRELISQTDDLQAFYIHYLEKNWVIDKEKREVSLVMDDAQTRYEKLLHSQPEIEKYVPLQDIASHLGITPTQLSRIRKRIK